MKKFILTLFIFIYSINIAMADLTPSKCFELGFCDAAKAYNSGNMSVFDMVTGCTAAQYKKSPCSNSQYTGMGYMSAFRYVVQYGPRRNTYEYNQAYHAMKMLETYYK